MEWRLQYKHFPRYWLFVRGIHWSVPGEFPAQRPVTRSFHVFFDLRLNKPLSKQSWGWWFETLSRPLWRHCNGKTFILVDTVWINVHQHFRHKLCDTIIRLYCHITNYPIVTDQMIQTRPAASHCFRQLSSGSCFNIKVSFRQCKNSYCKDKTASRSTVVLSFQ